MTSPFKMKDVPIHDKLLNGFFQVRERYGIKRVYYPYCTDDSTPILLFDRVIFVDENSENINFLKQLFSIKKSMQLKSKLINKSPQKYVPDENIDAIILMDVPKNETASFVEFIKNQKRFKGKYLLTDASLHNLSNVFKTLTIYFDKTIINQSQAEYYIKQKEHDELLWVFKI